MDDLTMHFDVKININASEYGEAYGLDPDDEVAFKASASQGLELDIRQTLEEMCARLAEGTSVAGVAKTGSYVRPYVLIGETLSMLDWNRLPTYAFIRAWGKLMGSSPAYIGEQVRLACEEKATRTAIFRLVRGEWRTFEELTSSETVLRMRFHLNNL